MNHTLAGRDFSAVDACLGFVPSNPFQPTRLVSAVIPGTFFLVIIALHHGFHARSTYEHRLMEMSVIPRPVGALHHHPSTIQTCFLSGSVPRCSQARNGQSFASMICRTCRWYRHLSTRAARCACHTICPRVILLPWTWERTSSQCMRFRLSAQSLRIRGGAGVRCKVCPSPVSNASLTAICEYECVSQMLMLVPSGNMKPY